MIMWPSSWHRVNRCRSWGSPVLSRMIGGAVDSRGQMLTASWAVVSRGRVTMMTPRASTRDTTLSIGPVDRRQAGRRRSAISAGSS